MGLPGWSDIRNFAEGSFGGSALMGPVGSFVGGAGAEQHPDSPGWTGVRDVGALAIGAGAGVEAGSLPWWGSAGGAPEAAPFYGDLSPEYAGMDSMGGGGGLTPGFDDPYADSWSANASKAAGGLAPGGMSVSQMFLLGMGGLSAAGGAAGLYSAYEGRQAQKKQQQQQQSYYDQLNDLMAHPERVTSLPGYQFNLEQGQEALQRRMASMGYGTSGNLAEAMTKFGQDYATSTLGNQEQLLASQYGRASPPTATMPDPTSLAMSSLSNMGYGMAPFAYGMR